MDRERGEEERKQEKKPSVNYEMDGDQTVNSASGCLIQEGNA